MIGRIAFASLLAVVAHSSDYNIVNLDNSSLPLLTGKHLPAFVRFDKDYPHGEKADAFKALATGSVGARVLIGSVGISTYGEKLNQDLAERYGYKTAGKDLEYSDMDKEFPKFRFFPANGGKDVDYTGAVTLDALTLFLKQEAKVYFGLKGTVREFDKLAAEYIKASDKAVVIAQAKAAVDAASSADDKESAAYYVRIMVKTRETANWFGKEFDRLQQIVDSSKVAPEKKDAMRLKMNRLSAFVSPNDEL